MVAVDFAGLPANNKAGTQGAGAGSEKVPSPSSGSGRGAIGTQTDVAVQAALDVLNQELGRGLPDGQTVRTQLRFDKDSARIVAEVVDQSTGAVVDSFPPDVVLKLIAKNRESFGPEAFRPLIAVET